MSKTINDFKPQNNSFKKYLKLALMGIFLICWIITITVFWLYTNPTDAMGFSILYLWIILPLGGIMTSLLLGFFYSWDTWFYYWALAVGALYMLAKFVTFSLSNMLEFRVMNLPNFGMLVSASVISLLALWVGNLLRKLRRERRN
ncbi:hypothetical protein [Granulicatella seriolae]|uniref:Permease n=1 Tax=Granulicatella seriolae TaxID=2967226 RepID=A0ABT1WKL5_9LACT|nr:hypothetical protein [Granulicatella seriolae]